MLPTLSRRSRTTRHWRSKSESACRWSTRQSKSDRAKVLKLADKTSNVRAITASPSPDWSVKRRLEYVAWARDVVAGLRGTNSWLESQFDVAAEAAERS